jgi:NhaP-type Na+/H+ or K+/H+ antiporter
LGYAAYWLLKSVDQYRVEVMLTLSLPAGEARNTIVILTYCVVVFSILGQGLSIGRLAKAVRKITLRDSGVPRSRHRPLRALR